MPERIERKKFASDVVKKMADAGYKYLGKGRYNEAGELFCVASESQVLVAMMAEQSKRGEALRLARDYAVISGDERALMSTSTELLLHINGQDMTDIEGGGRVLDSMEAVEGDVWKYSSKVSVGEGLANGQSKGTTFMPDPCRILNDTKNAKIEVAMAVHRDENAISFYSSHGPEMHAELKNIIRSIAEIYRNYASVEELIEASAGVD